MTIYKRVFDCLRYSSIQYPDKIAVYDDCYCYTYQRLEEQTNRIANYLFEKGARYHDRIAISIDKKNSLALLIMISVMKLGAIYVPINTKLSRETQQVIISNCRPKIIISDSNNNISDELMITCFDENFNHDNCDYFAPASLCEFSDKYDSSHVISSDIAYIIHTSGSAGVPKGVMIAHQNIIPVIEWRVKALNFSLDTKLISIAPLYFDPIILEFFSVLFSSATLYVFDMGSAGIRHFLSSIQNEKITKFICVPSIIQLILLNRHKLDKFDFSCIDTVVIGGSSITLNNVRIMALFFENAMFYNGYGLTETAVSAFLYKINLHSEEINIPLGEIMDDCEFYILDDSSNALYEDGSIGELIIRGPNVMKGYWENVEATNKSLKKNPVLPFLPEKVLYTGDLVKIYNANIYFIGRIDDQIKINGYRVELGEIENFILNQKEVVECSVIPCEIENKKNIYCYIVLDNAGELDKIIQNTRLALPNYMRPSRWIVMDALPKLPNGKIDKNRLRDRAEVEGDH